MSIQICGAPCCWGVDDVNNPYLPPWKRVLEEAGKAGYSAIELGPYGYLPIDVPAVSAELRKNGLAIVAGTIFHDLLDPDNQESVLRAVDDICRLITDPALPRLPVHQGQKFPTPYMTVMDWGHDERDYAAGHSDRAPRLSPEAWERFMGNVRAVCDRANSYGVRPVIHPHAGGYIEFADEIDAVTRDIPYETAGLCLDTGHLYYSGMDPVEWLEKYAARLDYVHFKDVDETVYRQVLSEHIRFFEGCGKGAMCPIGKGCLDYPAIRSALDGIGYAGYITIEQERDPRNSDTSLRDVKASVDYLKSVGYQI
ncbi:sugar phosphate isomerase/epimerase family protein [Agathobaculum sp.]|uniref:sugar phosphate isomerase/epimerase family protein n=1 Tax=Agathobaculum sp. TaxID=2048138 RepID=UPI002A812953|nr:TIM barrel protein [Agathobaculum sp.]MDY3619129.1 TIM barrel protein [Agathobaculum sp.]